MANVTPMMQQYLNLKEQHKDCILFFRLGDFYEMFFDDAKLVSKELELTLTGKDCGMEERAPMCGVPYHAASQYITRLIEKGHKVAICEQLEDPSQAKGLVERGVIRIVTPGTVVDSAMLDEKANSFVLCVNFYQKEASLAYADVSTGEFIVHLLKDAELSLRDEITRVCPSEIITNDEVRLAPLLPFTVSVTKGEASAFAPKAARETLMAHFQVTSLTPLGLDERDKRVSAAGALMRYLDDTQKNALNHITHVTIYQGEDTMYLDQATRRNLELTQSLRSGDKRNSLLWLLDKTVTAMGARLLRTWIEQPLTKQTLIEERLDAVEGLNSNYMGADDLSSALEGVYDLERLVGKVAYQSLNARDCLAMGSSLSAIRPIKELLNAYDAPLLRRLSGQLSPLDELCDLLTRAINPDAPLVITEGDIIRDGFNEELDGYREAQRRGKQWILDMEAAEKRETGIKNLRIQYNRVFGFYIEVTKSNLSQVPLRYTRRQTLSNCERFITPELAEIERKITGAQQQSLTLESQLFSDVRAQIANQIEAIQQNAAAVKTADALLSLSKAAREYGYTRPKIDTEGVIEIVGGRHPVVERTLHDQAAFISNDTFMNSDTDRMLIITGPNMAGKSTYMRQVALITLMAHMGSFVPADSARISLVDRVFTRIGASDDLASGQSTFMMEMSETANILKSATAQSLIILDEIGRGTSTFDGLAIAWAVVEYLVNPKKIGAKTLFATHYHELSELEGRLEGVKNYCITVKELGEDVIFLRKIVSGGADKSYGVHVARLAGVPNAVVMRASEIQARLEVSDINQITIGQNILEEKKKKDKQTDIFHLAQDDLIEELQNLDVLSITPMDALNKLFLLREKARKL